MDYTTAEPTCVALSASTLEHSVALPSEGRISAARDEFGRAALQPGRWWVLHTRARNEKAVANALNRLGVGCYLPLMHLHRRYGRRSLPVSLPLFPGYVFLRGGPDECTAALRTNRVANVLHVEDQDQLQGDLAQIQRVTASDTPVDYYPALRVGRRCRISGGGLQGVEGVVLRRRDVSRMYIAATVLGQSAVIEIDSMLVEPID